MCALTLLSLGFAHKVPVVFPAYSQSEIAAYTLPDGTVPELCHTLHDTGDSGHHGKGNLSQICEVCRIAGSIVLPLPTDTTGIRLALSTQVDFSFDAPDVMQRVLLPSASPRAPPLPTFFA